MTMTAFSVIQGGLQAEGRWTAELRHPSSLRETEIAAWQDLLPRALSRSVFAEPDFVLTMAQHLADGRRLALLLVWRNAADGAPVLQGLLPLQLPGGLRAGRAAQLWTLPLAGMPAPVIDADQAPAVIRAALDHLASSGLRIDSLRLPGLPPAGRLARALREVAAETGRRLTIRPQAAAGPARPALPPLPRERTSLERVRAPRPVRDAVECFLVLEAARAGASLLADAAAVTALRVVTRRFAKSRHCGVDLVRRDGAVIAAAIRLGPAGQDRIWREAGCALSEPNPAKPAIVTLEAEIGLRPARTAASERPSRLIFARRASA
ncbi:hypothetical protein [Methylobacterium nodulans]|uniref:BioF2-like acetyltransferase domain-containing protein n=1 Tax=Methylobacterium nodulans (strain LMG 21967 / CNCM I-2342 / ORS 2060) TaxID=460265 RepID=B8IMT9_METNO|nr:hypothetical protein [Methylobacterium nodulans]ACL60282.1 conserved hypothetical protein [Methylobacterium nodulans ORS 2060]